MSINIKILLIILSLFLILSLIIYFSNSKAITNMSRSRVRNMRERFKLTYDGLVGANIFELTKSKDKLLNNYQKHRRHYCVFKFSYTIQKRNK